MNTFLAHLNAQIAEIEALIKELHIQREVALIQAHEAFGRMHIAEDLLVDIQDGISSYERKRLIELLGPQAQDASVDEIAVLLQLQIAQDRHDGLDKTNEAEEIEKRIYAEQDRCNKLKDQRDSYEAANSPEERQAIQQEITDLLADHRDTKNQPAAATTKEYDATLNDDVNFSVPGFGN